MACARKQDLLPVERQCYEMSVRPYVLLMSGKKGLIAYGEQAFVRVAPSLWNNLPLTLRETRYVIVTYSRSSPHTDLSTARHALFIEGRSIECLPPTEGALIQHCYRAVLKAFVWVQSTIPNPHQLNPASFGWMKKSDEWSPFWTDQQHVCEALRKLVSCRCRKRCTGNCKCCTLVCVHMYFRRNFMFIF